VYGESLRKWGHFVLVNELNGPVYSILWNAGAMLLYIVSFGMVATGDLTTGTMIAFLNYMAMINDPFNQLTNILQQFANVSSNLERVFETLETESAVKEKPDAKVLTDAKGQIDFDDVTFRYEDGYNILEHFNLHVKPGESIALVGPTGCGKTTIINMLTRFYDVAEGSVKVDGVDVKDYTIKSLRQNVGVIMQDPFIFKGTVLDNIRYGRPDAMDDECIEAAKEILADSFIERLPRAYNTQLAERGEGLSSGEKQMIGFARMVLKNPRVFIFDEATSSIDSETEEMIQNSLEKIIQGRTSFMVAHRLSTIKKCDRILVIGNKGIAEQGTHEELLKLRGKYFELCKEQ
ncbi:MAG: ABC transporter ATP-binding protein, partial [Christensenellales bacterium]